MSFNTDQGSRNAFISIINDLGLLRTPGFNFLDFVHDGFINLDVSLCITVFESILQILFLTLNIIFRIYTASHSLPIPKRNALTPQW